MTTPRSREEIEKELKNQAPKKYVQIGQETMTRALIAILNTNALNVELLLDIREILTKKNPTDV